MKKLFSKNTITIIKDLTFIGIALFGAYFCYHLYNKSHATDQMFLSSVQRFEAGNSWIKTRQKTILFMRDEYLAADSAVDKVTAYNIAENNYILAVEKFNTIDPLLLLAIQWKESSFKSSVVFGKHHSSQNAIGVCQLEKSTAVMMARVRGIQWSDTYLTDPLKNTELAVTFINVIQSEGDISNEQMLAAYNCCYDGANKWVNDRDALPPQTRDYVPKVMKKYKEYTKEFITYEVH